MEFPQYLTREMADDHRYSFIWTHKLTQLNTDEYIVLGSTTRISPSAHES